MPVTEHGQLFITIGGLRCLKLFVMLDGILRIFPTLSKSKTPLPRYSNFVAPQIVVPKTLQLSLTKYFHSLAHAQPANSLPRIRQQ